MENQCFKTIGRYYKSIYANNLFVWIKTLEYSIVINAYAFVACDHVNKKKN